MCDFFLYICLTSYLCFISSNGLSNTYHDIHQQTTDAIINVELVRQRIIFHTL